MSGRPPVRSSRLPHGPRFVHRLLAAGCVGLVGAGTLAFGAVYPWAHAPLGIGAAVAGLGCLIATRGGRPPLGSIAVALLLVAVGASLQLVPLPLAWVERISPGTIAFGRAFDLSYQYGLARHALSISPADTVRGLCLFGSLALFMLGAARLISTVGARAVALPLVAFGTVLAGFGIAQYGLTANDVQPLIYGFWKPTFSSHPFGPFVNPNHFAGWMLMTVPLGLAAFLDGLTASMRSAPAGRSVRVALLGSPRLGGVVASGGAVALMGLSIVLTRSRSALAAFAVATLLIAWAVVRRQPTRQARLFAGASAALLFLAIAIWAGGDAVLSKSLEAQSTKSAAMRMSAWKDAIAVVRRFPLTGTGLNTYGTAMMQYQTDQRAGHFREAHNDYLQIAAEGGLLLGVPVLAAIVVLIRQVRRRFREAPREGTTYWLRVGAVVGLACIALQSIVEFSLQMPANALLFALLAAVAIHRSPNLRE
ncbi:MAG: O-antigen ligase family protein [Vicinamibacterales bacterium]